MDRKRVQPDRDKPNEDRQRQNGIQMDAVCVPAKLWMHLQNTNPEIRITPHSKRKLWTANTIAIESSNTTGTALIPDLPGVSPFCTPHKWTDFISVFIITTTKRITTEP